MHISPIISEDSVRRCSFDDEYLIFSEIRDFPKNLFPDEVLGLILRGLRNCTNLRSCTWTRDGSLTSDILLALLNPSQSSTRRSSFPSLLTPGHQLRELEINGHHSNLYDPKLLLNFKWLERICIIMPTAEVVQILEEWVKVVQESLKSLDVICKVFLIFNLSCLVWNLQMIIIGIGDNHRWCINTHGSIT